MNKLFAEEHMYFTNLWYLKSDIIPDLYRELFADSLSKKNWKMAYEWFAYRKESEYIVEDRKKYFPDFLKTGLDTCMTMLDTAVLNGEYVDEFLKEDIRRSVYALILNPPSVEYRDLNRKYSGKNVHLMEVEAGECNEEVLVKRIGLMKPFTGRKTVKCKTRRIDDMNLPKFDYLRCYSMSRVEFILKGAKKSIEKYRPVIAVNIGHYESDFIQVPFLLKRMCINYAFYFRVHSYQGNDCIIYAIPEKYLCKADEDRR